MRHSASSLVGAPAARHGTLRMVAFGVAIVLVVGAAAVLPVWLLG